MNRTLLLLLLLYGNASLASEQWVTQFVAGALDISTKQQVQTLSEIYDCGETEGVEYCSFEQVYRGIQLDVVIHVEPDDLVRKITYTFPFNVHNYTHVQTSLRKDSYHLIKASVGGESVTVEELLNQGTAQTADKKLIEFLNLYPISTSKLFTWVRKNEIQNTLATETLLMTSDTESIQLIWNRESNAN